SEDGSVRVGGNPHARLPDRSLALPVGSSDEYRVLHKRRGVVGKKPAVIREAVAVGTVTEINVSIRKQQARPIELTKRIERDGRAAVAGSRDRCRDHDGPR